MVRAKINLGSYFLAEVFPCHNRIVDRCSDQSAIRYSDIRKDCSGTQEIGLIQRINEYVSTKLYSFVLKL